jgi:hypothetical protein
MGRIPALTLLLSFTTGCHTVIPFKPGQPVEVEATLLLHDYKQGGELIRATSLLDGLEAVEPARAEARASAVTGAAGPFLAGVGTMALGLGAVGATQGSQKSLAWIAGGAALWALAMGVATVSDRHLEAAVRAYNAQLPPPPEVSVAPFVAKEAPADGHGSASGVVGGPVLRF